ncbi:MAG TPA: heparinase II/III family protein [Bacteroidales bacterium]|nr:heparinase II/III family protein [Bacteroidales bacterium]
MRKTLLVCGMFLAAFQLYAQVSNPHILVNNDDKQLVLDKMAQQLWAKSIFDEIQKDVKPYVERHITDPQWILSRYLMHRVPGKRYTHSYSDNSGQRLIRYSGDAPVPTIRVSTYLRSPITEKGTPYKKPTIEELVPNDTSAKMFLFNPETNQKEWVDPQAYITGINGDINNLAQEAAILYWLSGEEKYAVFAADILDQWAKGAFYQEPIVGPCRTGFLDMQTLGDQNYRSLIVAYDFVKDFMRQKGYDMHLYEVVFEKMAATLAFRGFWNNNWYAAESSTFVFAALSLENKPRRDYFLQFILEKDTTNEGCGQLALPSTVEKWLTHDGHWKEPGGYHNYPVGNLLLASLALEKNGYDIFRKFPALFQASYAMLKYSFPNLTVGGFGDTGRAFQSAESLEIGLIGAVKYEQPILPEMLASMKKLIDGGKYKRESSGFLGLLCFLPEIPSTDITYKWPRTGTLEFAKYYLQRNGMDPATGLMVGVQGATYNHNHCNGMAMELYGVGEVIGIDAGTGPNYEHPMHRNYYSQWAAHNTVVAGGMSSSVPFSGSAGAKNIGEIELAAMEPMADKEAVSPIYSFTDTRYFDKSTNTNQSRTLALVRKSPNSGYYVDIYRSDNAERNDYVYHNIGDEVMFFNEKREPLNTFSSEYPVTEKDYPGFRFYTDVRKLENHSANLITRFAFKDEQLNDYYLQALVVGDKNRTYYNAFSPKTKTAGKIYNGKSVPLFTIYTQKEARSHPFVVVFEPYKGGNNYSVNKISLVNTTDNANFTLLNVLHKDLSQEFIFQSVDPGKVYHEKKCSFQGYFGIAGIRDDKTVNLYLGQGTFIQYGDYAIRSLEPVGAAYMEIGGNKLRIHSDKPVQIALLNSKYKSYKATGGDKKVIAAGPLQKKEKAKIIDLPAGEVGVELY